LTDCNEGSGCAQAPCSIGNCLESHWVAQNHMDLLFHVSSTHHPDTVIFNSGIWNSLVNDHEGFSSQERINDLLILQETLPQFGVQRLIWKTTTAINGGTMHLGAVEAQSMILVLEDNEELFSWHGIFLMLIQ
jgi:hypothetical protein